MSDQYIAMAAQALSRMAEARAVRVASNAQAEVPTCAGCMASEMGPQEDRERNCQRMCSQHVCQKQIWVIVQVLSMDGCNV